MGKQGNKASRPALGEQLKHTAETADAEAAAAALASPEEAAEEALDAEVAADAAAEAAAEAPAYAAALEAVTVARDTALATAAAAAEAWPPVAGSIACRTAAGSLLVSRDCNVSHRVDGVVQCRTPEYQVVHTKTMKQLQVALMSNC